MVSMPLYRTVSSLQHFVFLPTSGDNPTPPPWELVFRASGGPDLRSTWFSLILGSPSSWKSLQLFSFRDIAAASACSQGRLGEAGSLYVKMSQQLQVCEKWPPRLLHSRARRRLWWPPAFNVSIHRISRWVLTGAQVWGSQQCPGEANSADLEALRTVWVKPLPLGDHEALGPQGRVLHMPHWGNA